jgi:uncharacterized protein (UPF0276 family)
LRTSSSRATAWGIPVVLETITEMLELPGGELAWDEFLVEAANRADTHLLVDVTNIWINRENGITPDRDELFGSLGGARWAQLHIVGASRDAQGFLIDSHDAEISETLIEAYRNAVVIQPAPFTILERDGGLDAFDEVLEDIERCKRVLASERAAVGL